MCLQAEFFLNMEAAQLLMDYTSGHACSGVDFYHVTNSEWCYEDLINHLMCPLRWVPLPKNKKEEQLTDQLQVLGQKVISIMPDWKKEFMRP